MVRVQNFPATLVDDLVEQLAEPQALRITEMHSPGARVGPIRFVPGTERRRLEIEVRFASGRVTRAVALAEDYLEELPSWGDGRSLATYVVTEIWEAVLARETRIEGDSVQLPRWWLSAGSPEVASGQATGLEDGRSP